jgi:hypothetical protein
MHLDVSHLSGIHGFTGGAGFTMRDALFFSVLYLARVPMIDTAFGR